jgi:hypothetical protein
MPGATPIYGFPYPCSNDLITAASFSNLANAIDTKLADVGADADLALNRYNATFVVGNQAGIAAGVDTPMTNTNATYVIPASGIYLVICQFAFSTATTISAARVRVRVNAVQIYGRSYNFEYGSSGTSIEVPPAALVCAAGDTISFTFLYTGTGTATVSFRYSPRMVVRIA